MKIYDLDQTYNSVDFTKWNGRGKIVSRMFNSMSLLFPVGEKFFIQAVRPFEHTVNPILQEEIRIFYKQEAHHSREHRKFNKLMEICGVDIERINRECNDRLNKHCRDELDRLYVTVILEKITAALAQTLISGQEILLPLTSNEEAARLWLWHADEELDHEHVAMSVLNTRKIDKKRYLMFHFLVIKELAGQILSNYKKLSKIK